jgi:SAM-dependent methyltransferase
MDVLVACHCHKQKLKITQFPNEGNILNKRVFAKYGIQSLKYMEINGCEEGFKQYIDWKAIPNERFDRIWLMNCPVYMHKSRFQRIIEGTSTITGEHANILNDLFNEGWRILKPGGKIVIPNGDEKREYAFMRFAYMFANEQNPWKLSVKNIKDTEFHIDNPEHVIDEDEYHIYLEKPKKVKERRFTRKTTKK